MQRGAFYTLEGMGIGLERPGLSNLESAGKNEPRPEHASGVDNDSTVTVPRYYRYLFLCPEDHGVDLGDIGTVANCGTPPPYSRAIHISCWRSVIPLIHNPITITNHRARIMDKPGIHDIQRL